LGLVFFIFMFVRFYLTLLKIYSANRMIRMKNKKNISRFSLSQQNKIKLKLCFIIRLIVLCFCFCNTLFAQNTPTATLTPNPNSWVQFRYNTDNSGFNQHLDNPFFQQKWQTPLGQPNVTYSSPPVVLDLGSSTTPDAPFTGLNGPESSTNEGILFVGTTQGKLLALNTFDGSPRAGWPTGGYQTQGEIYSSPAVLREGTNSRVFFGSSDGLLRALDINGNLIWQYQTSDAILSSPTEGLIQNGTSTDAVMVGSNDGNLYCFAALPTGGSSVTPLWVAHLFSPVISKPALSDDGASIYVGTQNNTLYLINAATGQIESKFVANGPIRGSPALQTSTDGTKTFVYFGAGSTFYMLQSAGGVLTQDYSDNIGTNIASSAALGGQGSITNVPNNLVLIGSDNGSVYVFAVNQSSASAAVTATFNTGGQIFSSIAATESFFVVGSDSRKILTARLADLFNLSSPVASWSFGTAAAVEGSPVLSGNSMYIASDDGNIYAFSYTNPGPATHFDLVNPSPVQENQPFTVQVIARDASGNIAAGYTGNPTLTGTSPYGTVGSLGTLAFTASSQGIAYIDTKLGTAGLWNLTATDAVMGISGAGQVLVQSSLTPVPFCMTPVATIAIPSPTPNAANFNYGVVDTKVDDSGNAYVLSNSPSQIDGVGLSFGGTQVPTPTPNPNSPNYVQNGLVDVFNLQRQLVTQWYVPGTSAEYLAVNKTNGNVYVNEGTNTILAYTSSGVALPSIGGPGTGVGQFTNLQGIAVDAAGYVYGVDAATGMIQKFTSAGVALTPLTPGIGINLGQMNNPQGMAVGLDGSIYVADVGNNRVDKFSSTGGYQAVLGAGNFNNANNTNSPYDVTVDANNQVNVSDNGNNQVQVFSGSNAYEGFFGSAGSGPGQGGDLGLDVDANGFVYVADPANNRVNIFAPCSFQNLLLTNLSATPNPFNPATSPTNLSYTLNLNANVTITISSTATGQVYQQTFPTTALGGMMGTNVIPWNGMLSGSPLPNGTYLVSITASAEGQQVTATMNVQITTPPTPTPTSLCGSCAGLSTAYTGASSPRGLAIDPVNSTIFVANAGAGNVMAFPLAGGAGTAFGSGVNISDVAVDSAAGYVYVVDNNIGDIAIYNANASYGSAGTLANGDTIRGICFVKNGGAGGASNALYVTADSGALYRYDGSGASYTLVKTIAGGGNPLLNMPEGLAMNSAGTILYVCQKTSVITSYSYDGTNYTQTAINVVGGAISAPFFIDLDPTGSLAYISQTNVDATSVYAISGNTFTFERSCGGFQGPTGIKVNNGLEYLAISGASPSSSTGITVLSACSVPPATPTPTPTVVCSCIGLPVSFTGFDQGGFGLAIDNSNSMLYAGNASRGPAGMVAFSLSGGAGTAFGSGSVQTVAIDPSGYIFSGAGFGQNIQVNAVGSYTSLPSISLPNDAASRLWFQQGGGANGQNALYVQTENGFVYRYDGTGSSYTLAATVVSGINDMSDLTMNSAGTTLYIAETGIPSVQPGQIDAYSYNGTTYSLQTSPLTGSGLPAITPYYLRLDPSNNHAYIIDDAVLGVLDVYDITGPVWTFDHACTLSIQLGELGLSGGNVYISFPNGEAAGSGVTVLAAGCSTPTPTPTCSGCLQLNNQWGSIGTGNGQFTNAWGISAQTTGSATTIFVADSGNNRIQVFDTNGNYLSQFGGSGTGNGTFNSPFGVYADSLGNIYVADEGNELVQKFTYNTVTGTYQFVLQWGSPGTVTSHFSGLFDVATDPTGTYVYTVEAGPSRIQKFTATGGYVGSIATDNTLRGIAVNANYVYVSDPSGNIQRFDLNLTPGSLFQWGTNGNLPGKFESSLRVSTDSSGNVYVADTGNARIQKFDPNGNFLCLVNSLAPNESFFGLTLDSNNFLYSLLSDNGGEGSSVVKYAPCGAALITPTPTPTTTPCASIVNFGVSSSIQTPNYGPPSSPFDLNVTHLYFNYNLTQAASVTLTVANTATNQTVYQQIFPRGDIGAQQGLNQVDWDGTYSGLVVPNGTYMATISVQCGQNVSMQTEFQVAAATPTPTMTTPTPTPGAMCMAPVTYFGPSGASQPFQQAWNVAVDANGNAYVSDNLGAGNIGYVIKFNPQLQYVTQWQVNSPGPISVNLQTGFVFVNSAGTTIQEYDPNAYLLQNIGGLGTGAGQFTSLQGVAVDGQGHIYGVDSANNSIQEFDSQGNYLSTFAYTTGSALGKLNGPQGMGAGPDGSFYVSETGNDRVQQFDAYGNPLKLIGQGSFGTDASGKTPYGVATDALNNVYVSDNVQNEVQVFDPTGGLMGQFGSAGSGLGQGGAMGLDVDTNGFVFVADPNNNRINIFGPCGLTLALTNLLATPPTFDPNQTADTLSYNLNLNAMVKLSITNASNQVVYQQTFPAGTMGGQTGQNQVLWNGLISGSTTPLPQGTYTAVFSANMYGEQASEQVNLMIEYATPTPTLTPTSTFTPIITPTSTNTPTPVSTSICALSANQTPSFAIGQPDIMSSSYGEVPPPTASSLWTPNSVIQTGNSLLVSDSANNRILIYSPVPSGNLPDAVTVIGQQNFVSSSSNQGSVVGSNTLNYPIQLWSNGKMLIVADRSNNRVLIYNDITRIAAQNGNADLVLGQPDMVHNQSNQGGNIGQNTLSFPSGVFYDGQRLFISDTGNNRILIYNSLPTSNNQDADSVIGQPSFIVNSLNQGFSNPTAQTLGSPGQLWSYNGTLFVVDYANNDDNGVWVGNDRVLSYSNSDSWPSGSTNIAADGIIGQNSFTSNLNPGRAPSGQINDDGGNLVVPTGICVSNGQLYVSNYYNVLIYNQIPTGTTNPPPDVILANLLFSSKINTGASDVYASNGVVYVSDPNNSRVIAFTCENNPTPTPACVLSSGQSAGLVIGQPNFTTDSSSPVNTQSLNGPEGVFQVVGNGAYAQQCLGVEGMPTCTPLPTVVVNQSLFVSDSANNRVLIYNSAPTTNWPAAVTVIGQPDLVSTQGNQDGSASAKTLLLPRQVWSNGTTLIVADSNNNRVLIYNNAPGLGTANGSANVVIGQLNMSGEDANQDGSVSANTLSEPSGVFYDGQRLYISDQGNNRVLVYNSLPTSNGASANEVIGQPNFVSYQPNQGGSTPSSQTLDNPFEIWVDNVSNSLYVADSANNRILIYNNAGQGIDSLTAGSADLAADAVVGQASFATANSGLSAKAFNAPRAVCVNQGQLYVADQGNDRVLVYNEIPAGTANPSANVVLGQPDMNTNTNATAPSASNFSDQVGGGPVALQAVNGQVYAADRQYNRVLVFGCANFPTPTFTPTPTATSSCCQVVGTATAGPAGSFGSIGQIAIGSINHSGILYVVNPNEVQELNVPSLSPVPGGSFQTLDGTYAITADSQGNVYVPGLRNLSKYNSAGQLLTTLSMAGFAQGISVDANGNIYVSEENPGEVQIFPWNPTTHTYETTVTITSPVFSSVLGGILIQNGRLYVADANNNQIDELDEFGNPAQFGPPQVVITGVTNPAELTTDSSGNLYVAASNGIFEYNPNTTVDPTAFTLNHVCPPEGMGLAVDSQGNVYSDTTFNNVNAGIVQGEIVQIAPCGVHATSTPSCFSLPATICTDSQAQAGDVLFAMRGGSNLGIVAGLNPSSANFYIFSNPGFGDIGGLTVERSDPTKLLLSLDLDDGIGTDAGDVMEVNGCGQVTATPWAIGAKAKVSAYDPVSGQLFITDDTENKIFYVPSPGGNSTVAVQVPIETGTTISNPRDLVFDNQGNLYMTNRTDPTNSFGTVVEFPASAVAAAIAASPVPMSGTVIWSTTGTTYPEAMALALGGNANQYLYVMTRNYGANQSAVYQINLGTLGVIPWVFSYPAGINGGAHLYAGSGIITDLNGNLWLNQTPLGPQGLAEVSAVTPNTVMNFYSMPPSMLAYGYVGDMSILGLVLPKNSCPTSPTPTNTPTWTPTVTPTLTPTNTTTNTATNTPTNTETNTFTNTATNTYTPNFTPTPTFTRIACGTNPQLDLQIRKVECQSPTDIKFRFQVYNTDTQPVSLSALSIAMWINDPATTLSVDVEDAGYWSSNNNPSSGTPLANLNLTALSVTNCTDTLDTPTRYSNWELTTSTTDPSVIPPGGSWVDTLVDIANHSDANDYSQEPAVQADGCTDQISPYQYVSDSHFVLYYYGVPCAEYTSHNVPDPQTGLEPPCNPVCPRPTATNTITNTPTNTYTPTYTPTNTQTPTFTFTPSPTNTQTPTLTFTPSPTNTKTPTLTFTPSPTNTKTPTLTFTPSPTNTKTPTLTFTPSPTNTKTPTPTITLTNTVTNTPSKTNTPANTPTNTVTSTPTKTNTPTNTSTNTRTNTATNTPVKTNTPTITATNTKTFTPMNTPTKTATSTFTKTNTPTITPTNTKTFTATNTPTKTPTNTLTFTKTNTPAITPTKTNTFTPTKTPTKTPTITGGVVRTDVDVLGPIEITATNTPTKTQMNTATNTPTNTRTITATFTPTSTPTKIAIPNCLTYTGPKLNLQIACDGMGGEEQQFGARIYNYGSTPVTLANVNVVTWLYESGTENMDAFSNSSGQVCGAGGTNCSNVNISGYSTSHGSFPACTAISGHFANQSVTFTIGATDAVVIPANGGYWQSQGDMFQLGRNNSQMDNDDWADDYSHMGSGTSCTDNSFHDSPYYALFYNGVLVQEVTDTNGDVDPNTGQIPCTITYCTPIPTP